LVYFNEENHLLHAEVRAGVFHEHVIFDEGSGVAQNLNTFAGSQFSLKIKPVYQVKTSAMSKELMGLLWGGDELITISDVITDVCKCT